MSWDDDREPDPEDTCAQRVLKLIQAMAQASSVSARIRLARQARAELRDLQPVRTEDDAAHLRAARRTVDECQQVLTRPANRRPV